MRPAVSVAFAIALCVGGRSARASDADGGDVETIHLDYRVTAGCPDERAFVEGVLARTKRGRFTTSPAGARRLSVEVRRQGDRFAGTLVIARGAERARREITSARCADVVGAFVFFVSIALDPERGSEGPQDAAEVPEKEPETRRAARVTDDARAGGREAPPPPARHEPPPRRSLGTEDDTPPSRSSFHLSFGSGALAATGVAEPVIGSVTPVVDFASDAFGPSPSIRVGALWGTSRSQAIPPAGRVTVGLRALTVSGCALRLPLGSEKASVRLCALVEAGTLLVRPFAIARPTAPVRPWGAIGPMLRAEIELLPKLLSVGLDAALAIPLEREEVHVRSGPTVELVQPVGARLGALVLVRAL